MNPSSSLCSLVKGLAFTILLQLSKVSRTAESKPSTGESQPKRSSRVQPSSLRRHTSNKVNHKLPGSERKMPPQQILLNDTSCYTFNAKVPRKYPRGLVLASIIMSLASVSLNHWALTGLKESPTVRTQRKTEEPSRIACFQTELPNHIQRQLRTRFEPRFHSSFHSPKYLLRASYSQGLTPKWTGYFKRRYQSRLSKSGLSLGKWSHLSEQWFPHL